MHLLALTRWNAARTLEQELPVLAPALGLGLYDARLRLVAPLPQVIASGLLEERARELCALLHGRGHGAVYADAAQVADARAAFVARAFELGGDGLTVRDEMRKSIELLYARITSVLRAFETSSEAQTISTSEKKLDIGTAVLTGGLKFSKTVTKVEKNATAERQQVAFIFHDAAAEPVLLREYALGYEGLGELRGLTAHESFEALLAQLRNRAPQALHDDRLFTHKRRVETVAMHGVAKERTVSTTNAGANYLAARLLMLAHAQGQL